MRKLAALAVLAFAAAAAPSASTLVLPRVSVAGALPAGKVAGPALPAGLILRRGSSGTRVRNLQWLLAGHRPNVYTFTPYFRRKPNGLLGNRTAAAIVQTKRRLGYPESQVKPFAGRQLELILEGRKRRPLAWVVRATTRLRAYTTQHTPCADKAIRVAVSQLGVHEVPLGSNDGPQVSKYQSVTGAYHAPWCASWVQWTLQTEGYGTVANDSAYVPYIRDYATWHQWLHAVARPGALVIFYSDSSHIGIVQSVTTVGVWVISGNWSDAVSRTFFAYGSVPMTYAWLPGCVG